MNKFKMSISLIIIVILSVQNCSGQLWNKKKVKGAQITLSTFMPDAEVSKFLGPINQNIIFAPDSVICYTLKPYLKPDSTSKMLSKYVINERFGQLDNVAYKLLQLMISDSIFYKFDNMKNKCYFDPYLAFEFFKKKESLLVLISFDCEQWGIDYKGSLKIEEFNLRSLLVKYAKSILLKDQYIQSIK